MGGVLFLADNNQRPRALLWRCPFSSAISNDLVSFANPKGNITDSDLELAGIIVQQDIAVQATDMAERTNHTLSDNTPAVTWQTKGSTTATGPAACLLRLQALHARFHRCVTRFSHVPGSSNPMANVCSRAWHLDNGALPTHFDLHFPQGEPWEQCHLRPKMLSALTSTLSKKQCELESLSMEPTLRMTVGKDGWSSAQSTTSIPVSHNAQIRSPSCKSSASDAATDTSPPANDKSSLEQWRMPHEQWHRNTPFWGPKTLAKTPRARPTFN